jgi:hypothetical protein
VSKIIGEEMSRRLTFPYCLSMVDEVDDGCDFAEMSDVAFG